MSNRVITATGKTGTNEDGSISAFEVQDDKGEVWNLLFDTLSVPNIVTALEAAYAKAVEKIPADDPTKPKRVKGRQVASIQVGSEALSNDPALVIHTVDGFQTTFGLTREIATDLVQELSNKLEDSMPTDPRPS